jgi:hypothetical protein
LTGRPQARPHRSLKITTLERVTLHLRRTRPENAAGAAHDGTRAHPRRAARGHPNTRREQPIVAATRHNGR